jgi:ABC-type transporter Mla maintaining outer membrane lipid asymmetry ATPase subunit MlaF
MIKCLIGLEIPDSSSIKSNGRGNWRTQPTLNFTEIGFSFFREARCDSMTVRERAKFPLTPHKNLEY